MLRDPLILVVEDDRLTRNTLVKLLAEEGYRADSVANGHAALQYSEASAPDVILLDRGLPGLGGLEVCEQLRARPGHQPVIIMLTGFIEPSQRLQGFAAGVDDYVTKPYGPDELVARIRAILRRMAPGGAQGSSRIRVDERLEIDFYEQEVLVDGQRIGLGRTESRLLQVLLEHAGDVVPFGTILTEVWGPAYTDAPHYVHLYVTYLRRKIERDLRAPRYIVSERGMGYRFGIRVPTHSDGAPPATEPSTDPAGRPA